MINADILAYAEKQASWMMHSSHISFIHHNSKLSAIIASIVRSTSLFTRIIPSSSSVGIVTLRSLCTYPCLTQMQNNDDDDHNSTSMNKKRSRENDDGQDDLHHQKEVDSDPDAIGLGYDSTEYEIQNGLRHVKPYGFRYTANTKGRWEGQRLIDIFSKEFNAHPESYYDRAFRLGLVKVNGSKVDASYQCKSGDFISHLTHRHEPPVAYVHSKDMIISETKDFLVVNKPASIPVHPSGAYRFNSITHILAKELGYRNLHAVYRLDRLTSGVLVFAKSAQTVSRLMGILNRKQEGKLVRKMYIARVCGRFPQNKAEWETHCKEKHLEFQFDVAAGAEASASGSDAADDPNGQKKKHRRGADNTNDAYLSSIGVPKPGVYWEPGTMNDMLSLSYPLKVLSFKNGSQKCDLTGKPSYSKLQIIDYDQASNTSLVKCEPLTGRTHQLRLHLQFLGFPIANDPDYGPSPQTTKLKLGESSESNQTDNDKASETISMSSEELMPKLVEMAEKLNDRLGRKEISENEHLDLSLQLNCAFCSPFGDPNKVFTFRQLRHEGVWLHAVRYFTSNQSESGIDKDGNGELLETWDWSASLPEWTQCFAKDKVDTISNDF